MAYVQSESPEGEPQVSSHATKSVSRGKDPAEYLLNDTFGPKEGQSYHGAISEATSRVAKTLSGIYNSNSDTKAKYSKEDSAESSGGRDRDLTGVDRDETLEEKGRNSEETHDDEGGAQKAEDSDDEDHWNLDEAKQTVKDLLNSLQTEKRTREMEGLRQWFEGKAKKVPEDEEDLAYYNDSCEKSEFTHKHALTEIENDVSTKVDEKDKGLKKFEHVLNTMVRQGRSTARAYVDKKRQLERDRAELLIDNDHLVELEDSIQDLRQKLLLKESDGNKDDSAQKAADLEEKDILAVINTQEKELKSLNARWDVNERRVKMLRLAFNYVSNGSVGPAPSEMVVDTLEEMKSQVRKTKLTEMMKAADIENAHLMEPPDDTEVMELEQECVNLQSKLEDIESQVMLLQAPEERERELQARLDAISGGQGGGIPRPLPVVTPEESMDLKEELLRELALVQDKNLKLQPTLTIYDDLMKNAEASLSVMADERQKYVDLIQAAKANLAAEFEVDEDLDESDPTRKKQEERRKEVLALLDEEEAKLLESAEDQETGVTAAIQALQEEQRRIRELGWEFERQREESAEFDLPPVTRSMIQESQKEEGHEMMKLEVVPLIHATMTSRVSVIRHQIEEQKRASVMQGDPQQLAAEGNEDQPADLSAKGEDKEQDEEKPKHVHHKPDMDRFIRLHNENLELVQELEDIETQLRALKSARGHPLDFGREGALTSGAGPEEVLDEIKQKQQELFQTRMKWWNIRQEPPRTPAAVGRRKRPKQAGSRQSTIGDGDDDQPDKLVKRKSKLRGSKGGTADSVPEDGDGSGSPAASKKAMEDSLSREVTYEDDGSPKSNGSNPPKRELVPTSEGDE